MTAKVIDRIDSGLGRGVTNGRALRFALRVAALGLLVPSTVQSVAADPLAKGARVAYVALATSATDASFRAFRDRLRELGWIEGQNLVLDQHWGEGHMDRLPSLMLEALAGKPDVLVTSSTPGALAAKNATSTVPIVVAAINDPVQSGVVSNLARPDGNLTALAAGYIDGFAGKWLELLLEVVPRARTVAVIWNLGNPVVLPFRPDLEKAASTRGVRLRFVDVREPRQLSHALREAKRTAQAAVVVCESMLLLHAQEVVELAARYKLPAIYCLSRFAHEGGLMAYGTDLSLLFRRAAEYVDKILKGAKVGDLPVEQPARFELVINMKTAKALGLTIPRRLLLRADEIIE